MPTLETDAHRMDNCKQLPTACLPPEPMRKNTRKTLKTYPKYRIPGGCLIGGRELTGKLHPTRKDASFGTFPVRCRHVGRSHFGGRVLLVVHVPSCIHGPIAPLSPGCSFRLSVPIWKIPAVSASGQSTPAGRPTGGASL